MEDYHIAVLDIGKTNKKILVYDAHLQNLHIGAFISDAYFIDIGVPADYERAQVEMVAQR